LVSAAGFKVKRGDRSAAVAFEVLMRLRGPDDMPVLPSPA
jgi:hypothetical protein